jgi:hypothetical protein
VHNAPILDQGRARLSGHERHRASVASAVASWGKGTCKGDITPFSYFLGLRPQLDFSPACPAANPGPAANFG